jgi:putative transposase
VSAPSRRRRQRSQESLDVELADLPAAARWREWMLRVEAAIFASARPVPREALVRLVGQDCRFDDLIAALCQTNLRRLWPWYDRAMSNPFRYFNSSPDVIRLVVMMYVRYPLSLRNVEDLLAERGIDISHETVRFWWNRFGPMFAAEIRKRRVAHMRSYPQWRWHLDEVFVKVNGTLCYLWRAVDHEGEVLEAVVTARRDKAAALKLLKRIMKKYGRPQSVVTDGLRAYSAAMDEIGAAGRHEVGRRLNNRAENSHQPFRRRERAMQRFRSMKTLQKFSSVHAQVHNHFNQERHLVTRDVYKQRRSSALAEWRALAA